MGVDDVYRSATEIRPQKFSFDKSCVRALCQLPPCGRRLPCIFFDRSDADKDMTAILHGSSHWAKADEIQRAGLMSQQPSPLKKLICGQNSSANAGSQKASVIVGGWRDPDHGKTHYLKHSGPEHVIAIAPTRSGKGVGLVVPTLLNWTDSVLV